MWPAPVRLRYPAKCVINPCSIVRNTLWDWQSLQVYPGANTFYSSCDALEVKDGEKAPSSGWGLDHALSAWSSYWKDVYLNQCGCSHVHINYSNDSHLRFCSVPRNICFVSCFIVQLILPAHGCASYYRECLGTYDPTLPVYTNTTIDNAYRSWYWLV
jgi:hypothetical protein